MPLIQVNAYTETDKDDDELIQIVERALLNAGVFVHDVETIEVEE